MFSESLSWMFGPLTLVFGLPKIRLSAVKIEPWSKWRRALKQPRSWIWRRHCLVFNGSRVALPHLPIPFTRVCAKKRTAVHYLITDQFCATFPTCCEEKVACSPDLRRHSAGKWRFSGFLQTISAQISARWRGSVQASVLCPDSLGEHL